MQETEPLACKLRGDEGHSGDVAARSVQTDYEAELNGIGASHKNDRSGRGRSFGGERRGRPAARDYHGDLVGHQIGRQRGQLIQLIIRPPVFNRQVLAFDIAEFTQTLSESSQNCGVTARGLAVQESDHGHGPLLRMRCERPSCRGAAKSCDELPPSHQRSPTAGSRAYRDRGCMSGLDLTFLWWERRLLRMRDRRDRSGRSAAGLPAPLHLRIGESSPFRGVAGAPRRERCGERARREHLRARGVTMSAVGFMRASLAGPTMPRASGFSRAWSESTSERSNRSSLLAAMSQPAYSALSSKCVADARHGRGKRGNERLHCDTIGSARKSSDVQPSIEEHDGARKMPRAVRLNCARSDQIKFARSNCVTAALNGDTQSMHGRETIFRRTQHATTQRHRRPRSCDDARK